MRPVRYERPDIAAAWGDEPADSNADAREMPSYVKSVTRTRNGKRVITEYNDGVPVRERVLDAR